MRLMSQLVGPHYTSRDVRVNLRQWRKGANEYEAQTGDRISEHIKKGVDFINIAPHATMQHLMINQQRLDTSDATETTYYIRAHHMLMTMKSKNMREMRMSLKTRWLI